MRLERHFKSANAVLPFAMRGPKRPSGINDAAVKVVLSHRGIQVAWVFVFVAASSSGLFLLATAYVYLTHNSDGDETMLQWLAEYYLNHDPIQFLRVNRKAIGVGYLIPALPFLFCCVYMIWHSLRARRLSFGGRATAGLNKNQVVTDVIAKRSRPWQQWWNRPVSLLRAVLAKRVQPFSIRGKYFKQRVVVAELLEIALQTMQAYRYSESISSRFVNAWCGSIILVNCWSEPLLRYITVRYHENALMERLQCVLVDQLLDFLWGTTLQLFLIWPYIQLFHAYGFNTEDDAIFDKEFETVNRELMLIFVTSWPNYVFNIFSFVSSALTLSSLCAMLREGEQALLEHEKNNAHAHDIGVVLSHPCPALQFLTRAAMIAIMIHGVIVFVVSLAAGRYLYPTENNVAFCQDRVYPWFTLAESCVGRQINCTASGITGRREEISAALAAVDPNLVLKLGFCDCPALEIPVEATGFHAVTNLRLVNSTLATWGSDAAISDAAFPQLTTLQVSSVIFACIPIGLFQEPLPSKFEWIFFSDTNAGVFLDVVGDSWNKVIYFDCYSCDLLHIPRSVRSMYRLSELVLEDSLIPNVTLDDLGISVHTMNLLLLDENPSTAIADEVWASTCDSFWSISLQNTNITEVPDLLSVRCTPNLLDLYMYKTPVCEDPPEWIIPLVTCKEAGYIASLQW